MARRDHTIEAARISARQAILGAIVSALAGVVAALIGAYAVMHDPKLMQTLSPQPSRPPTNDASQATTAALVAEIAQLRDRLSRSNGSDNVKELKQLMSENSKLQDSLEYESARVLELQDAVSDLKRDNESLAHAVDHQWFDECGTTPPGISEWRRKAPIDRNDCLKRATVALSRVGAMNIRTSISSASAHTDAFRLSVACENGMLHAIAAGFGASTPDRFERALDEQFPVR